MANDKNFKIKNGLDVGGDIVFEGSTADDFETTVTVTDPTADQTFTIPDQTGTAMLWQQPWPDDPGTQNIAIGEDALSSLGNNLYCVGVGFRALESLTTGFINVGYGAEAARYNQTGFYNTALGYQTCGGGSATSTAPSYNTCVGHEAGERLEGSSSTMVGYEAGRSILTTSNNTAIGYQTGIEAGSNGTFLGYRAGYNGSGNNLSDGSILIGYNAGTTITSGDYNTVIGYEANVVSNISSTNVGIGKNITVGSSNNVAIGNQHYQSSTADRNVTIGLYAGGENSTTATTGDDNISIGYYAGRWVQANNNVFIGRNASGTGSAKTGNGNCGIGYAALNSLSSGGSNSAYGNSAGYKCSTGGSNTYIGTLAGGNDSTTGHATGSNCSFLGYNAIPSSSSASNEITLGDSNITSLRCNVTTISSLSDERDKTDIEDLPYGLDFINDMRPVQFTWDRRDGSMNNVPDFGFIAQDLHDVELEHSSTNRTRLVKWDNPDKLEADYVRSYPILVKAVQELSAKCDALEARLAALEGV